MYQQSHKMKKTNYIPWRKWLHPAWFSAMKKLLDAGSYSDRVLKQFLNHSNMGVTYLNFAKAFGKVNQGMMSRTVGSQHSEKTRRMVTPLSKRYKARSGQWGHLQGKTNTELCPWENFVWVAAVHEYALSHTDSHPYNLCKWNIS